MPWEALAFGAGLTVLAEIYLAVLVNPLTRSAGLDRHRRLSVCLHSAEDQNFAVNDGGSISRRGAAADRLGRGAWRLSAWKPGCLFAILFLWQFPHFLAIAWMYREDYSRAGILMLPVVEPDGRVTAQQIVVYTVLLLPVSLLPTALGISGKVYLYGAIVLGLLFLYSSVRAAFSKSRQEARRLLLASVIYLPLLFILMVLDR